MINVISTINELFAFMEKEKQWFSMLAFIYVRVATPESGSSLGAQKESLLSYSENLGLKHAFILEEIGGAYQAGRSSFNEIVQLYEKQTRRGSCPALIVDSFDRLTRNCQDMSTMFKLVNEKAFDIHMVGQNQVLSGKSKSLRLLHG